MGIGMQRTNKSPTKEINPFENPTFVKGLGIQCPPLIDLSQKY